MYFEERIIDGVMHYRTRPDSDFIPMTLQELTARYAKAKEDRNKAEEKPAEQERTCPECGEPEGLTEGPYCVTCNRINGGES